MKTEQEYLADLKEIRSIMEQSSRFISLSGLSGIMAGIYALLGAYLAHRILDSKNELLSAIGVQTVSSTQITWLVLDGLGILVLTFLTGYLLTRRRALKQGISSWGYSSRRLLGNMAIPLVAGGIFTLLLILKKEINLIAPCTLLFYGLALIHGSRYTLNDIRYLGIIQIVLALIATWFRDQGLVIWAVGFGLMHILYGAFMYWKYEREGVSKPVQ